MRDTHTYTHFNTKAYACTQGQSKTKDSSHPSSQTLIRCGCERSRTLAACSTVAGVLVALSEAVSFATPFLAPHPSKDATIHVTTSFSIAF